MFKRVAILMTLMLAGLFSMSCASHHHRNRVPPPAPPPAWTQSPKPNDSVNMYRIGFARGLATPAEAREAAYQDALRQITKAVMVEVRGAAAGAGTDSLPLTGAEIMPGCSYACPTSSGYDAWVQVSYPLTEKRSLVESLKK
jgi:hypothetical protein